MMSNLGRWIGPALGRLPLFLLLAAIVASGSASARDVTVSGQKGNRFGRIILTFDQSTKVAARVANSVLMITFAEPAKIKSEKLAIELAPYVTTVRRDPDGTGLRLALATPVRVNVLEAAERVYVDLLPTNWTGLPPSLPSEVIAELAARMQEAEAKLRAVSPRPPEPKIVRLRLGELPTLTRLTFDAPPDLPVRIREEGDEVELAFDGPSVFENGGAKPKLAAGILRFDTVRENGGLVVRVKRAPGYSAQSFREPDGIVLDVARPPPAQVLGEAPPREQPAPQPVAKGSGSQADMRAEPPKAQALPPSAPPREAVASGPQRPASPPATSAGGQSAAAPPAEPRPAPGTVQVRVEAGSDGPALVFPFPSRTPAAAYRRAGQLTLVFDTPDRLDLSALQSGPDPSLKPVESRIENGLAVLRFPEPASGAVRFSAEGSGWRLATSGGVGLPADSLQIARALDDHGRALVRVGLADAHKAHWLKDPDGARIAVATSAGRVQGLPLPRSFVEFALAPSLHGVVVEAWADDVSVGLGQAGVAIGRDIGLSLSPAGRDDQGGPASRLALPRDTWLGDVAPGAFERYESLVWDSAHSSAAGRAEARARIARFLIANGLDHEASSVLAAARADDHMFARRREALLLSGIAAARAGRTVEARAFLESEGIAEDPEAILWRAVADAKDRRWEAALAAFRRSMEVAELYPDDLSGPIRLLALKAALETGDIARGEAELGAIDRLAVGTVRRDEHDLARARVEEAGGRGEVALKTYEKLAAEAELPVAAEAMLRAVRIGTATKALDPESAIARLETLSVLWRGGDLEIETIADLARLYGREKRWRDMFAMSRRATAYFPRHPTTRTLQEDSARVLEELLLGPDGDKLTGVQALSLYFDFKELAPVGRRGDEIVRRLADRLVELDLLDQAADLLQYQVDRRLTGAARATVAARLAAIRLMNGKPLLALGALHATRLSELPEEIRRFRYMLEARAQADLSRTDLALEILDGETGVDFDRLRTGVLWTARRWREAGEAGEALLGTRWDGPEPLSDRDRTDLLRAAIAYAFADERISLDRLKQKFGRKIMDSPDAKTFDIVVRPGGRETREFRLAAQEATKADSLRLLLSDWRARTAGPLLDEASSTEPAKAEPAPQAGGSAERSARG